MSRILEFQPTDEQTVVARVLVELHQAIDTHFPGVNPSTRQFSKTVLTNQGESTRIDNAPSSSPSDKQTLAKAEDPQAFADHVDTSRLSLTPKTGINEKRIQKPLQTADLQQLMGETSKSRNLKRGLLALFFTGFGVFLWLLFMGTEGLPTFAW